MANDLRIALTTTLNERAIAPLRRFVEAAGRSLNGMNREITDATRGARGLDGALGGMRGPANATRQVDELTRRTQQAISLTGRLEKAWNAAGNIIKGVGTSMAAFQVGKMILQDPLANARSYEFSLANTANIAYSERKTIEGRQAGMSEMDQAVRRATVEGVSRTDALAGLKTMIAGGTDRQSAMTMLPSIAKFAFAGEASVDDVAQLAIKAQKNGGISAERMPRALEMALVAGQLGNFEFKDMAKWLPQQLAVANQMLGMSGERDFSELLAINQMAGSVAGSSAEAGNNVVNFLSKINSNDTANDAKRLDVDLAGSLATAREKGTSPAMAFINLLRKTAEADPAYVKLQERLAKARASGATDDEVQTLQAMSSIMQGKAIGKLVQDRQALGGMLGIINDPKGFAELTADIRSRQGESDLSQSLLKTTAQYGFQQADNAKQAAQYDGLRGLNGILGEMGVKLSELMGKYPVLAAALEDGRLAVMVLAGAATTAAGALALLGLARGKLPLPGSVPTATPPAGGPSAVRTPGSHLTGPLPASSAAGAAAPAAAAASSLALPIAMGAAGIIAPIVAIASRENELNSDSGLQRRIASFDQRIIKLTDSIDYGRSGVATERHLQNLEQQRAELMADRQTLMEKLEQLTQAVRDQNQKPLEVTVNMDGREVASGVNGSNAKDARRQ